MRRIRERLTYANATATIALFLALGGATAIAASQLPPNSVGRAQLKAKAVGTGQLDRNAVRTGKIAYEAVRPGKIAKGAVVTDRLRNGAVARAKLTNLAVGTGKLGNEAVRTGKLASGAVTTGKLADDSVTGPKVKESTLGEVPSAARVNGFGAACPSGTKAVTGLCFDANGRADKSWEDAVADCADEGRRLPVPGELIAATEGLGNVATGVGEWTDSYYFAESQSWALGVDKDREVLPLDVATELPYRCVTQLLR